MTEAIEKEYKRVKHEGAEVDRLYELLFPFLTEYLHNKFGTSQYINREMCEDIAQDICVEVLGKGMAQYEEQGVAFASWCRAIARNRMIDFLRRGKRLELTDFEGEAETLGSEGFMGDIDQFDSPERILIKLENRLEQCEQTKRALKLLTNLSEKAYMTVSTCYTLILFHRYEPASTKSGSPEWAFKKLADRDVTTGARRFEEEMYDWLPSADVRFGSNVWARMYERHGEKQVGNLIFGEEFKVKDFENWAGRIRKKLIMSLADSDMDLS